MSSICDSSVNVRGRWHPRATLVEQDQPRPRRDQLEETDKQRVLPGPPDVAVERHEHDIDGAVANDLVRDRDITAPRDI